MTAFDSLLPASINSCEVFKTSDCDMCCCPNGLYFELCVTFKAGQCQNYRPRLSAEKVLKFSTATRSALQSSEDFKSLLTWF